MKIFRLIKSIILGIVLLAVFGQAVAQEKENKAGVFGSERITAYVEGYQTKIEVLGLFKPDEITMQRELSPAQTMDHLTTRIKIKDKHHPVLKYFDSKAKLLYKGQWYAHNVIPDINASQVMKVAFQAAKENQGQEENYLEVFLYGEEYLPHEQMVFRGEPKRINYYALDGRIISPDELPNLYLKVGPYKIVGLFGKEAVDKFGDAKYAEGIGIITREK